MADPEPESPKVQVPVFGVGEQPRSTGLSAATIQVCACAAEGELRAGLLLTVVCCCDAPQRHDSDDVLAGVGAGGGPGNPQEALPGLCLDYGSPESVVPFGSAIEAPREAAAAAPVEAAAAPEEAAASPAAAAAAPQDAAAAPVEAAAAPEEAAASPAAAAAAPQAAAAAPVEAADVLVSAGRHVAIAVYLLF
jgi:hypothetical protein